MHGVLDLMQVFAKIDDSHTIWVQHLAGPLLRDVTYVDSYEDFLLCHKKVILLPILESNHRIDVVRQLIAQGNYLIFVSIHYSEFTHWGDMVVDCPEVTNFPIIMSSQNKNYDSIGVDSFYFYTITDSNVLRARHYTIDEIFRPDPKPHTFLYLNGANRPHRFNMWHALNNRGTLDQALWSWLGYRKSSHDADQYLPGAEDPPTKLLPEEYESRFWDLDRVPMYQQDQRNKLRFKTHMQHGHWTEGHVVPQQYIDTYFTFVSECSCTPGEVYITEKTYKPIMAGHPFIMLNSAGSYEYLHSLGLKTFDGIIDESFDQEPDLNQRISMIADQVKKLVSGNLNEFLKLAEPICRHNQEHYIDQRYNYYHQLHLRLADWLNDRMHRAQQYFDDGDTSQLKKDYHV